ncbi:selO [Symbiodinium necroappetens]|uniref:Selenoprotein O n=1 Tax=Symbiodinium necroappetens TaxID=1628268 RepID=A0A813BVX7_9DINO|nr:selO [Symbiodinium necroappetens]
MKALCSEEIRRYQEILGCEAQATGARGHSLQVAATDAQDHSGPAEWAITPRPLAEQQSETEQTSFGDRSGLRTLNFATWAIVETWIAARADFFVGTIESRFTMSIQLERSFLGKPHRSSEQEFCKEYKRFKPQLKPRERWLFPFGLCRRRCTVACAHRWRWLRSHFRKEKGADDDLDVEKGSQFQVELSEAAGAHPFLSSLANTQDADERPGGVSDVPSWQIPELVVECPKRPGARIHKGTSLILPEAGGDLLACIVSSLPVLLQIRPRWILGYSMAVDGVSLRTMYRQLADSGPCVMIVEDSSNCIFGAFLSEGLRRLTRNVKLLIMLSTMLGVRLKAPLSSRASSSCARSSAGAPRSQLRSMGLLLGPPGAGAGAACTSGSRLCVAAGLLSGFSLGKRRGSTLRATETAESLECLNRLAKESDQSWLDQLSPDPETDLHVPNTDPREVKSGHYVEVWPTPLPDPKLVIYSQEVADMLGIPEDEVRSDSFTAFFSGQRSEIPVLRSWCTPYALAIMGQRMVSNCPFGNGNGYGDGRAISVGELLAHGQRFELQLKGAGRTPFCRGGDGRAVLRSSIREFLASEAMHHLGVETTRALSLVVSGSETVRRPWYADNSPAGNLYSSREPNTMVNEACAITTRVAPSFLRVGHVDLFARRAAASPGGSAATELEQIVEHALFREYPDIAERAEPLPERAVAMLEAFADRLAALVSGWLRVGFCQGNFNSDNCLVGGRTMDYGPFGFIDRYDPLFAKWTGSGEHYGFLNQPQAAMANYHTLVTSVAVLLKEQAKEEAVRLIEAGAQKIRAAVLDVFTKKLGFASSSEAAVELWKELEPLLRKSKIDYTIFWRQLMPVLDAGAEGQLGHLDRAFYEPPNDELRQEWDAWLQKWAAAVLSEGEGGEGARQQVASRLGAVNPKYVPREWMLVEAYTKASEGDYTVVQELYELFKRPYDEQPAYERYYSRGPDDIVSRGGVAYMT